MTFTEKFGKISKKLEKADISKYTENFAIQVTMDDEDCGGTFFVAYIDGAYKIEPYDYFDNTANINIMASTLEKLIDKKLTVDEAFGADAVAVNGNANHVVMLFNGFEKKVRKAPAKKAEKKAEPKKTAAKKTVAKKETVKEEPKAEAKKEDKEVKAEVKAVKKPVAKKEPSKKAKK